MGTMIALPGKRVESRYKTPDPPINLSKKDRTMKTLILTAVAAVTLACSAQAGTYNAAFKSAQNGKFVRAGVGPGTLLAAVCPQQDGGWGNFELVELGNQRFALRSVQNGKYVRAGVGPGTLLAAVSDHVGGWESFEKIELGGNRIAIRSVQNGKYVRAGVGPGTLLAAVSDHIGGWETFEMYASSSTPPVPPVPPAAGELVGSWRSNIFVNYEIENWADGYLWRAPQLNQVGIVHYSASSKDAVTCQWWDNQVAAGTGTGTIVRNAQGLPVQIHWNNGVIFFRK
jgi:hypothetical protein